MNKILNQDEVDALLRGISGGDVEVETDIDVNEDGVISFDLANQDRIIRGRMPVLEIINDRFSRIATNAMTNTIRKRVDVNVVSIDMSKFGDFMRSLPVPTSINIFKIDPLRGNALMVVDTRLVFALVENLFGGAGSQPKIEGRDFTPIEQRIIKKVINILLVNFEAAWQPVHQISVELVRSEINPQFASIVPPSDVVVVVSFEVELESSMGALTVVLPYSTIEPIRAKLNAAFQSERLEVDDAWIMRFKERLLDIPLDMKVTLGNANVTGRQLLDMGVGDILVLDTDEGGLLNAEVQGILKFQGLPGFVKGNKAFKIVEEVEVKF